MCKLFIKFIGNVLLESDEAKADDECKKMK